MREALTPAGIPDRLYGRRRGHPLRPRQERLLAETLPRLQYPLPFADPALPLWLEVGFGGGEHALALSQAHPGVNLIASEVFENGLCALLSKLTPEGAEASWPPPANLRLWPRDARHLIAGLPDGALDRLYLMFPDPWPKARHAKRRFVHPAFLPEVARVLRPSGEWRIATDDPTYQAWVADTLDAAPHLFARAALEDRRPPGWPATRYEAKAVAAGRRPLWWIWRRLP